MAEVVNDVITLFVSERALDSMNPEQFITVTERPIETTGLKWTLRVYLIDEYRLSVCLWVSGPVQARGTVSWGCKTPGTNAFESARLSTGETTIAEGIETRAVGKDGFVKCEVEFTPIYTGVKLPTANIDEFFKDATHFDPDVDIAVGGDRLKVHRSMLSLMSPVFHSYFQHDTQESQTGVINITDFEFKTVQNVIDYVYGRDIEEKPIVEIIDMLRFADKYDIKTVTKLEYVLQSQLTWHTFSKVAQYAWDFNKQNLQTECAQYFRKHSQQLTFSPEFLKLKPKVLKDIICAAALQPV
uniref:BTB domain-containing protein n=1 Tax=Panagrellus redivivus TaxID=6233 RepID=A0A7E4VMP2_PANRE